MNLVLPINPNRPLGHIRGETWHRVWGTGKMYRTKLIKWPFLGTTFHFTLCTLPHIQ